MTHDTIIIDKAAVSWSVSQLRSSIDGELAEAESKYGAILSQLDDLDGAANAQTIAAVESSLEKARVTCEAVCKLLTFIANTSAQMEIKDIALGRSIMSPSMGNGGGLACRTAL